MRDFTSVSPSAKWVLLMKGHTSIPYALQTAERVSYPEKFAPDFSNPDVSFWARTMHFENRYLSIDQLLEELPIFNILELSGGYSFRGLNMVLHKAVHFIDTDLPDMVDQKKALLEALDNLPYDKKGKLEVLSLNVLDETGFNELVEHFPSGPIAIVSEGLLVYLNMNEKEKLCSIIHGILKKRGGYWITGDIYLKIKPLNFDLHLDKETQKFFDDHDVENNRFNSFEEAENLFNRMGFVIDKEADVDYTTLSSFPYLMKNLKQEEMQAMGKMVKIHTSWRLKLA